MRSSPSITLGVFGLLAAVLASPSIAQDFDLSWYTIDSGGVVTSVSRNYELSGTIAQHDTGVMVAGDFTLAGGFWFAPGPGTQRCIADLTNDAIVDPADLAIILGNWGPAPPSDPIADLNDDGVVGPADLAIVLGNWGACP